jgi:hypothetical protein
MHFDLADARSYRPTSGSIEVAQPPPQDPLRCLWRGRGNQVPQFERDVSQRRGLMQQEAINLNQR